MNEKEKSDCCASNTIYLTLLLFAVSASLFYVLISLLILRLGMAASSMLVELVTPVFFPLIIAGIAAFTQRALLAELLTCLFICIYLIECIMTVYSCDIAHDANAIIPVISLPLRYWLTSTHISVITLTILFAELILKNSKVPGIKLTNKSEVT